MESKDSNLRCLKHPKYTGRRRRPTNDCKTCWKIFRAAQPPESSEQKIEKAMQLFGRTAGKHLFVSLGTLAQALNKSKDGALSTASRLINQNRVAGLRNRAGEIVYICRLTEILHYTSHELIEHLSDAYFNLVGAWLKKMLLEKNRVIHKVKEYEQYQQELELPGLFIYYFVSCFAGYGLVNVAGDDSLLLPSKEADFSASNLRRIAMALRLTATIGKEEPLDEKADPFRTLEKLHLRHDQESRMACVSVETEDVFKILHICEIRIGHQDTDIKELENTVSRLEAMLPVERPDIIVISGLVQGAFQHLQKNRRHTLVRGLRRLGKQLAIAKNILARVSNLGVKVIVNKGSDDRIWAENTAVYVLNAIQHQRKPIPDAKKKSAHWLKIDMMKGTKAWDTVWEFAWRVAIEYQLRIGRRFRSADEMAELTGGEIRMEESLMLFEAYNRLINGENLNHDHSYLDIESIPLPGKDFEDFSMVDDCQFEVVIKERSTNLVRRLAVMEKNYFRLTANSMINDPTKAIREISAQLNSMGAQKPDVVFIEREQQPFIVCTDHTLVASLPGMQKINITRRSQNANIQLDPSHRIATTRREVFSAGTMPMKFLADGSFEVALAFPHYMEKAGISGDRIAVPLFMDWQIGSVTANCDLQAIFMDYCLHHILPEHPTYFFYGGDIVQGHNYKSFPVENQRIGLISLDSQKEFLRQMLLSSLMAAPKKWLAENLLYAGIVPGNHEWNSGGAWPGVVHCETIRWAFETALVRSGVSIPVIPGSRFLPRVEIVEIGRAHV